MINSHKYEEKCGCIRKFTAANRLVQSEWAKLHDLVKKRVPE
jgi:hypothetical protein